MYVLRGHPHFFRSRWDPFACRGIAVTKDGEAVRTCSRVRARAKRQAKMFSFTNLSPKRWMFEPSIQYHQQTVGNGCKPAAVVHHVANDLPASSMKVSWF